VRAGDTLSSIAAARLGSAARWEALWWVNRNHVPNPDAITAGEDLSMPMASLQGPWLARRALDAVPRPPAPKPLVAAEAAPAPPSGAAPAPAPVHVTSSGGAFEHCVMEAESGGVPNAWYGHEDGTDPPADYTGASGLFGDLLSTWDGLGLGYPAGAWSAPVSVQMEGFQILYSRLGASPWYADPCPAQFGY
jgi:hypothetical protein